MFDSFDLTSQIWRLILPELSLRQLAELSKMCKVINGAISGLLVWTLVCHNTRIFRSNQGFFFIENCKMYPLCLRLLLSALLLYW